MNSVRFTKGKNVTSRLLKKREITFNLTWKVILFLGGRLYNFIACENVTSYFLKLATLMLETADELTNNEIWKKPKAVPVKVLFN